MRGELMRSRSSFVCLTALVAHAAVPGQAASVLIPGAGPHQHPSLLAPQTGLSVNPASSKDAG